MKKRFLPLLLALALCLGLAVPGFAAGEDREPPPTVSLDLPDGYTAAEETDTYQILRFHTETVPDGHRYSYIYDEGPTITEITYTALPLGTGITINGVSGVSALPGEPAADGRVYDNYSISVSACSDPDGDGVFNERIFYANLGGSVDGGDAYTIAPTSEKGPFTPPADDGWPRYATCVDAGSAGFTYHGGDAPYLTATSDALYQLFGSNTLIRVEATLSGAAGSEPEEIACFLLSGRNQAAAVDMAVSGLDGGAPAADMEFTLRGITEEFFDNNRYSAIYTRFTRDGQAEPVKAEGVSTLTLGSTVTVSGLRDSAANPDGPWDTLSLYAWSDPDGDGVYDQWLYTYYGNQDGITLLPLSAPGPFTYSQIDAVEGGSVYSLSARVCGPDTLTSRVYDTETVSFPSRVTLSAEFLAQLFGPDTLVQLKVVTRGVYGDPSNPSGVVDGPSAFYYIPAGQVVPPSFTDVPDWCADAVDWAAQNGVTTGVTPTAFAPGRDCTQVQILTFLWRALDRPDSTATTFSGLAGDYAPAANWAYETGLIDGSFIPSAPCTRSQAVSYIWQAFEQPEAGTSSFPDVDAGADYAKAVDWAVENGITEGYTDGSFRPDAVCSRGVIATLLHRAYVPETRLNASM